MKASEAAREAARIMSERGHCKRLLEDDTGAVCFNGALLVAMTGVTQPRFLSGEDPVLKDFRRIGKAAGEILTERGYSCENPYCRNGSCSPVHFNNDGRTSAEDVILLLKTVAERLES